MKPLSAIVAYDENYGIGKDNKLLFKIPNDMKYFKQMTTNQVVVMGRKTYESIGKPLSNRVNIVLSTQTIKDNNMICVHSIDELEELLDKFEQKIFVIGGESIYKALYPYYDTIYATKMHTTFDADTYFPNLEEQDNWEITSKSSMKFYRGVDYQFLVLERKS